ncbi:MAG: hypothetical protein KC731_32380, partial [Myxococcales bacterium]|nr:hypothetical protein [Myxococcales bacterium]
MGYMIDGGVVDRTRFSLRGPARLPPTGGLDTRWLEVGGARLRIAERRPAVAAAEATTFVLAPDPPNVLEHHRATFEQLVEGGRVIGLELPGFGFSSLPKRFSFSAEANA